MTICYRHTDRETGVACSRCDRPICPDCMTPTSVGMRCPECAGEKTEVKRPAFDGSLAGGSPATRVLIGINVAVFALQLLSGGPSGTGGWLFADGALCGNAIGGGGLCSGGVQLVSDGGEWWRVVSSGFLHGGLIHLGLNMFVLYILGQVLEPAIGTARFVALYLVSLVAGGLGALIMSDPFTFTVGASGAIYGLFLATILVARHRGLDQVVSQLGFWLALNLVLTFTIPNISAGGHIGGMLGGALAALLVIGAERRMAGRETLRSELIGMGAIGLVALVAAVVVANAGLSFTI